MNPLPLFDRTEATAAASDAVARVAAGAATDWRETTLEAVQRTARQRLVFTTDDVLRNAPELERCPERRLLGWAMREAKKQGWCQATTGWANSARVTSHGRPKRVWLSLVMGGKDCN